MFVKSAAIFLIVVHILSIYDSMIDRKKIRDREGKLIFDELREITGILDKEKLSRYFGSPDDNGFYAASLSAIKELRPLMFRWDEEVDFVFIPLLLSVFVVAYKPWQYAALTLPFLFLLFEILYSMLFVWQRHKYIDAKE